MGARSIPARFNNPGMIFACLGFLEASEVLCGPARGGFVRVARDGAEPEESFLLDADGADDPVRCVLGFLAEAHPSEVTGPPERRGYGAFNTFPTKTPDQMALPVALSADGVTAQLDHWTDGSDRDPFKLYAGNRSAFTIMSDLLRLFKRLYAERHERMHADPLNELCEMRGSFNFDPRGAWTAIDAGYSPNVQNQRVLASPTVEILAAWGLQNARPNKIERRRYGYGVWRAPLTPMLARAALGGSVAILPQHRFTFELALAGKNKVVTFAQEEMA